MNVDISMDLVLYILGLHTLCSSVGGKDDYNSELEENIATNRNTIGLKD